MKRIPPRIGVLVVLILQLCRCAGCSAGIQRDGSLAAQGDGFMLLWPSTPAGVTPP